MNRAAFNTMCFVLGLVFFGIWFMGLEIWAGNALLLVIFVAIVGNLIANQNVKNK